MPPSTDPAPQPLSLVEVAALLIKHFDLHEGLWELGLEMQISIGQLGVAPDQKFPGAMVGVSRIGLTRVAVAGPNAVDAAAVNPALIAT